MTKAELQKKIEGLEKQLKKQQEHGLMLVELGLTTSRNHAKEMKKIRASRKRLRDRLVNVFDLATALRTQIDDGFADATNNRILNTIIRLASGR